MAFQGDEELTRTRWTIDTRVVGRGLDQEQHLIQASSALACQFAFVIRVLIDCYYCYYRIHQARGML